MSEYFKEYPLKNGTLLLSVCGYMGEEDFYAMYDIIGRVLKPENARYGVDSMCVDGSFTKDGILVRMCSESAYDECCFVIEPAKYSKEEEAKVFGWLDKVAEELHKQLPR